MPQATERISLLLQYLGDSLEVSGRHILEEDLVQEIVLMANPGVILMPGQTLPLTIFRPNVISLMRKLIDTTKVWKIRTIPIFIFRHHPIPIICVGVGV